LAKAAITMSTDDERKAAKKAQEVVGSLTPSTPRTDKTIILLGHAAGIATEGSMNVSSEATLNYVRAATALRAVCNGLEDRRLTHEMIDRAKQAVDAWVSELQ
jgi:hypothetical protein